MVPLPGPRPSEVYFANMLGHPAHLSGCVRPPQCVRPRRLTCGSVLASGAGQARREGSMTPDEMLTVYQRHRAAEVAPDCFLDHVSLGLRSEGRRDATRAYEELFGAFPDLGPGPGGMAFGDEVLVAFGELHGTMKGPWLALE